MPKPSLLLTLNSLIVLAITMAFVAGSVPLIVSPHGVRPMAFFGALVFTPIDIVFGILVFRSVFSRSKTATDAATVLYFLGAGFLAFGIAVNVGEALLKSGQPDWRFLLPFAGIGFALVLYAVFCGLLSMRWSQRLRAANRRMEADA